MLVLHAISNDHNIGAIIRSAAFFGIETLILSGLETQTAITTSMYRVAEGGMEFVKLRRARETAALLKELSKTAIVVGACPSGDQSLYTYKRDRQKGAVLVLGNEETGLPPDVKAACGALVRVPGTGNIESLNVSVSAALFMSVFSDK
jgi:TrmH RNA methyltransferase